jgi:hypothetical protein
VGYKNISSALSRDIPTLEQVICMARPDMDLIAIHNATIQKIHAGIFTSSLVCLCQLRMLHEHANELTNTQIIHVSTDHETWHCIHVFLNVFYTAFKNRRPDHHRPRTGYGGNPSNVFRASTLCRSAARRFLPLLKKNSVLENSGLLEHFVAGFNSSEHFWSGHPASRFPLLQCNSICLRQLQPFAWVAINA